MDWDSFTKQMKELGDKIDYQPDLIVGITRGGAIPARLLSTYLGIKNMICISIKKIGEERKVVTEVLDDLVDKNILLIEDQLETGRSLEIAKKYLESKGANVKSACLYIMPITEVKPDYFLTEINYVENFPWE